ncbi:MAG TPA: TRZ/ATZ family hydrolase [Casimicrobiaceae bacterium]|jgi:5-methylthioadenosine/S-adenosylhomocysteine deaminase
MDTPKPVDLVIDARYIVPIEPPGMLVDHALVVDDGRIVALAPSASIEQAYVPRKRVVLSTHVLIPGLVNAHTHAAMVLMRGIADDVPLKTWLEDHIWPREGRYVSPEFVADGTLHAAAEMLKGGITCANDMYFYPDAAAHAYESAGMRALIGMPVLDFPTPYASDADVYLAKGFAARDAFKHSPRLAFALAPHAPYTVADETWRKIVMYARQLDLPIHTHIAETQTEVETSRAASGESPVLRLDRLGATGPSFIGVHAVHLQAADIETLATQQCNVVHCPVSNMKLASGIAPVTALAGRGINVALGTDGAASNNRLDLFSEMRIASLLAKVATGDAGALPATTALHMATLGGAIALGLDREIGSLVPGKQADAVAIDLSDIDELPMYDPISHLVHVAGRHQVTDVWVGGDRVVDARCLTTIDEPTVVARARVWQQRLQ